VVSAPGASKSASRPRTIGAIDLDGEAGQVTVHRCVAIEAFALELAIPKLTEGDFKTLRDLVTRMDDILRDETQDPVEMFRLDQDFHLATYKPAGRPSLIDTITALRDRCRAYMHMASILVLRHMEQSQEIHRLLLDACENRAVAEAKDLISMHIQHMLRVLRPILTDDAGTT
jgi:DNA-binding GntR family transcriptional regulator